MDSDDFTSGERFRSVVFSYGVGLVTNIGVAFEWEVDPQHAELAVTNPTSRMQHSPTMKWDFPQRVIKIVSFGIRPDLNACVHKERSRAVRKAARVDGTFRVLRVLPVFNRKKTL